MKRLAVFLDGTWNDPSDRTNVRELFESVVDGVGGGSEQRKYYHKGVGTGSLADKLLGGALGKGLSDNVQAAYQWIVANFDGRDYDDPVADELYIFGFSRGAYTARSVAGVIIKCGLLNRGATLSVDALYTRYRQGKDAVPIYNLRANRLPPNYVLTAEDHALLAQSRWVKIHFIGVWDTVGALGIPWTAAPLIGRGNFYFHDTNLSMLIGNAYQALAIDENRGPYKPTLWTKFLPAKPDPPPAQPRPEPVVEQRWFSGAHSNVGGGYDGDLAHQIPLRWLQDKASACGLTFSQALSVDDRAYRYPLHDSYREFLGGVYRFLRLGIRFWRPIGSAARTVKGGLSDPINEWIDLSVFRRYQAEGGYRPKNLVDWAARMKVDLSATGQNQRGR